jgi:hypothetical protein
MAQKGQGVVLRDPGFLFWLEKFLGEWELGGLVQVSRRYDGFLEAFALGGKREKPSIGLVIKKGKLVKPAQSPLGPYPIMLSERLMYHWLSAEEAERLKAALHVGSGREIVIRKIEEQIAQMTPEERKARWLEWWEAWAGELAPLSEEETRAHQDLFRQYRLEN